MHPSFLRVAAIGATLAALPLGCATARREGPSAAKDTGENAVAPLAPDRALTPDDAAARAIAVSPRLRALALRLDASARRVAAVSAPPDPSIAISLGVPIDGLGGLPISVSIMEGLGWLLTADALRTSAGRERDASAEELVNATVEVAAEARRATRALHAAREQLAAEERNVVARGEGVAIERAAQGLGESTAERVAAAERELMLARLDRAEARAMLDELEAATMSVLAVEVAPAIDAVAGTELPQSIRPSLDVIRARARLARAESAFAVAQNPLGSSAAAGAGYSRDVEDRESINGTVEFALPIFRRTHEFEALRAEVEAERAELAEAERLSALSLAQAHAAHEGARTALAATEEGAAAAERVRAALERAAREGEATRAALVAATAASEDLRARVAMRRIALANALARIESRASDAAHQSSRGETP
jgi:outer membrane protein TolC